MSSNNVVRWPKEYESLRLRCQKCSTIFNCYESDTELFALRLCPACYVEMQHPKLVLNTDLCIGLGLSLLAGASFWLLFGILMYELKQ